MPGTNVFAASEADVEGTSYRMSIWDIERGVATMRAKAEEFSDFSLEAVCTLPCRPRQDPTEVDQF